MPPLRLAQQPPPDPAESPVLQARAMDNLRFIRETMERAGEFTAISGWATVAIGLSALGAAFLAASRPTAAEWILVWMGEAVLALTVSGWAMWRKGRSAGVPLLSGPGRKFLLSFCPPILAGALITLVLFRADLVPLLPGIWMLLYGCAVLAAGSFSVRIVPAMGLVFMLLGGAALMLRPEWGDWLMAAGFGLAHIGFGLLIARRHGG